MVALIRHSSLFISLTCLVFLAGCQSRNEISPSVKSFNSGIVIQQSNPGKSDLTLNNMFGVNAYEWNFLQNQQRTQINENSLALIKTFRAVRHYLDWEKLEYTENNYSFNPAYDGSWDYDAMYQRCKQENILVLACIKTCPAWIINSYPVNERDYENVPAPYSLDRLKPETYIQQARNAFQFAARYGYNSDINPALVKVNPNPRWTDDPPNIIKIGMGLIHYIECDNERDKWWKGPQAKQSPEEYAANMSAFYDGNNGKMGQDVGVKNADPNMQVVMGGLASADPAYVIRMIEWCKTNRGLKPDGSINLCFDIINYHYYASDYSITHPRTRGVAPELSSAGNTADQFVALSKTLIKPVDVWITENGYDINPHSQQAAIAIGSKSALQTQADWTLRSAFLYMRHGIKKLFYYQLTDDSPGSANTYATSGLIDGAICRPAANYILQTAKLMGDYTYQKTISIDPLVDQYKFGSKFMYVLMVPDEKGRIANFNLDLGTAINANIYSPDPASSNISKKVVIISNGKLNISVTETPVFVEGSDSPPIVY